LSGFIALILREEIHIFCTENETVGQDDPRSFLWGEEGGIKHDETLSIYPTVMGARRLIFAARCS